MDSSLARWRLLHWLVVSAHGIATGRRILQFGPSFTSRLVTRDIVLRDLYERGWVERTHISPLIVQVTPLGRSILRPPPMNLGIHERRMVQNQAARQAAKAAEIVGVRRVETPHIMSVKEYYDLAMPQRWEPDPEDDRI